VARVARESRRERERETRRERVGVCCQIRQRRATLTVRVARRVARERVLLADGVPQRVPHLILALSHARQFGAHLVRAHVADFFRAYHATH